MDGLFSAALQEVAVEGTQGCSLSKLWALLQSAAGLTAEMISNRRAKQLLWRELINVPGMVVMLPSSIVVANSDPSIQDVDKAEELGLQLVAPESLRESSLGMYDLRVCDARLSKEQRNVLECIAKSRSKGITQSQLAKEFKIPGNKMFYLVKMLEVRGLVVRQATLVRTVDGNSEKNKHVPIVATNLLHLTRYAKDLTLSTHQRFEIFNPSKDTARDVPKSARDSIDEDEGSVPQETEFIIKDDLPAMQAICQKLEETEGKVLVVSDLKTSLGYRLAVGHRTWRRLVKRLQDAGLVEILSAQIEHKVRSCIRLVKSFDSKAFKTTNDETENEPSLKCAKRGQVTDLVAELPIDQQIYNLVDRSGSEGVQMIEVFNSLGLQNKRNYYRISTMLERNLLVSEAENHKRSTLYRLKTARNVNGCAQASGFESYEGPKVTPFAETVPPPESGFNEDCEEIVPPQPSSLNDRSVPQRKAKGSARKALQQARLSKGKAKQSEQLQDKVEMVREELPEIEMKVEPEWNDSNAIVPFGNTNWKNQGESPLAISFVPREFKNLESPLSSNIPVSTTRAQREKRILEKLQAEKFVLRVELHRWLEEVENRKNIMMDRKTLSRMLQGLQASGHCKCVMLSMPGLTNCGRQRTTEVVLLPSLVIDPELLSKIHEQVRKFDMMSRGHGVSRVKSKDSVPVLTGVPRMHTGQGRKVTKFDKPNENGRSMQANGFIPAKMVRVRLLHYFLWGYVNSLPEDRGYLPDSCGGAGELVGSCKIFGLANAVQAMPLELFLQVIGSFHKIENVGEWCKQGLCLKDLPKEDVVILLESNATGRLSWLIDVLRRLKLVRLVMGCGPAAPLDPDDLGKSSLSAVLTYAMEREPYLEEPAPHPLPSMNLDTYDVSPRARHEFSIVSKDGLDAYWQNLEYLYSGAVPVVARCAFPGSNVPELFGLRSWATLKLMTLEQRTELMKRVSDGGIEKRRPWHECVKIAKELNLSLQQVLRVSYQKNRVYRLQTLQKGGQLLRKRSMFCEPSHVKAYKKQRQNLDRVENKVGSEIVLLVNDDDRKAQEDEDDGDDDDQEGLSIGGQPMHDFSFVGSIKPSRPRSRRFQWSERLDRLLIAAYARQRAQLGALYHRVDWYLMTGLPAPPVACRRRMAQLRLDLGVRKALMSLCSLLTLRYIHHTQSRTSTSAAEDAPSSLPGLEATSVSDKQFVPSSCEEDPNERGLGAHNDANVQPALQEGLPGTNSGSEYSWDDMREPFLAAALDEVIRCRAAVKANNSARGGVSRSKLLKAPNPVAVATSNSEGSHPVDQPSDSIVSNESKLTKNLEAIAAAGASVSQVSALSQLTVNHLTTFSKSTSLLDEETTQRISGQLPGRALAAAGPTRRVRKYMSNSLRRSTEIQMLTNEQLVRDSIAVSNAVELVKLILLNCGEEAQLSGTLVEAVQRFKEDEVFAAVKYLRERGFLVAGQGGQTFVLSPKFFHDCSVSRFPVETGNECLITERWFHTHSKEIDQDWVNLPSDPHSGQLSHLLAQVSSNEFLLNPVLPATDIGEAKDNTSGKRKTNELREKVRNVKPRTASHFFLELRRERGFPGIEVSIIRSKTSLATVLDNFGRRSEGDTDVIVPEPLSCKAVTNDVEVVDLSAATTPDLDVAEDQIVTTMGEALSGTDTVLTELNPLPDLPGGGQRWGPNSRTDEQILSVGLVSASTRKSTLDSCILHWCSDSTKNSEGANERPHLRPDLLHAAYSVVEQAGEEGLVLEKLSEYLQLAGMEANNELETVNTYVHALESFELLKKLNAYDHIRIVEASKSARFYLHILHEGDCENGQQSSREDMPNFGKQLIGVPRSRGIVTRGCHAFSDTNGTISKFDSELIGTSTDLTSQLLIGSSTTTPVVTGSGGDHRIISLMPDRGRDFNDEYVTILPWLSQNGTVNKPMLKGLIRRVMGIISIHPGISEDTLLEQVKVLNPQSVRQLIQILELDGHLVVRSLPGPVDAAPPRLLQALTGHTKTGNTSLVKHYFVNPLADDLL
ncbi:unnamed protein product [Calypogeia fissa]